MREDPECRSCFIGLELLNRAQTARDWKLIGYRSGELKLFNIANDKSETTDLSDKFPERVAKMKAKLIAWEKEMNMFEYSGFK